MSRNQPSAPSPKPHHQHTPSPDNFPSPVADSPSTDNNVARDDPAPSRGRSEDYPSWLPRRPPPPAPASTFHSSYGIPPEPSTPSSQDSAEQAMARLQGAAPSTSRRSGEGRRPTPRSVRIFSMPSNHPKRASRESSDGARHPHRGSQPRAFSRATASGLSTTLASPNHPVPSGQPRPRLRTAGFHPEILRNPSPLSYLQFCLLPIMAFAHVPLQAFFDFNAVFMLLQVSKHPTAVAPGVPGSGKNWALASAAYLASFFVWFFSVFILYELIYSFYRRWRVKRPLLLPIYLSAPAFDLACMSSYTNFCFFQHIRASAWKRSQGGSFRDGLAELCYRYSQNGATVALLLPRAALSLALLFAFSSAQPSALAIGNEGDSARDGTFFGPDGTLSGYARGILIANAAWTAWRIVVLLAGWIGLWILSGLGCGGICGPRYRWEEEEAEKTGAATSDEPDALDHLSWSWSWRECTRLRVQEAFDFCLTQRAEIRQEKAPEIDIPSAMSHGFAPLDEVVMAATRTPAAAPPIFNQPYVAKRGVLSTELFSTPTAPTYPRPAALAPIPSLSEGEHTGPLPSTSISSSGPLRSLPYPLAAAPSPPASPSPVFPFPVRNIDAERRVEASEATAVVRQGSMSAEEALDVGGDEETVGEGEAVGLEGDDDEDDDFGLDLAEGEELDARFSSERETRSGSMSSLGQPINTRYPFEYRQPVPGGTRSSISGTPNSKSTSSKSNSHSDRSRPSVSGFSHRESIPESPGAESTFPPPPRHPSPGQRRQRAGTAPSSATSPVTPLGEEGRRTRTQTISGSPTGSVSRFSESQRTLGNDPVPLFAGNEDLGEEMEHIPEGSQEEHEKEDSIGLLSNAPSPKSSLAAIRHRASLSLSPRRSSSRSGGSGSRSPSSLGSRSRTQSLVPVAEGPHSSSGSSQSPESHRESSGTSSRSRTNSSIQQGEGASRYSDARSSVAYSMNQGDTFGIPPSWNDVPPEGPDPSTSAAPATTASPQVSRGLQPPTDPTRPRSSNSNVSGVPSSDRTVSLYPDVSEAPSSYVTAAPTQDTSSGRPSSTSTWAQHFNEGGQMRPH